MHHWLVRVVHKRHHVVNAVRHNNEANSAYAELKNRVNNDNRSYNINT